METVLISSGVAITVAALSFIAQWIRARADSGMSAQSRVSADAENLRKGLMEEIERQDRHIAAQGAEIIRLRDRVSELERENRLFRDLLGNRVP